MALVHADGFAHYDGLTQRSDVYNQTSAFATHATGSFGPNGTSAYRFSGSGNWQDYVKRTGLTTSGATNLQQFDFKIDATPSVANIIASVEDGATVQVTLVVNTSRQIQVWRGTTAGILLGTSTYVVPLSTWIHIGWKTVIGNSGSSLVHVWEDGDTSAEVVLNLTSVDTQDSGAAQWTTASVAGGDDSATYFANYIAMDGSGSNCNDLLGPADCWTLWANARSAPSLTDWSLSSGSDVAALLDDTHADDDVSYVSETTQNQQFTVYVDQIPYPDRTIKGAMFYASARLVSGSPTVQPIGYESGSPNLGTSQSPTSSYTYVMQPYSAMPSGSAFSTAAAFDALQWGLKLTSASTEVRCTQVAIVVIQLRDAGSKRNLLTGYSHEVTGDDNLIAGRDNAVVGTISQAHGTLGTVTGNRSVLFNLTGEPYTLTADGTFCINGDVQINGTVTSGGSTTMTSTGYWSILTDGSEVVLDSNGNTVSVYEPA